MKNVIVIGAGFVGQGVARGLSRDPSLAVTLVNDKAMISYKPLYPDVAGGRLAPEVIEYPLAHFAARKKIAHIVGKVEEIVFAENIIRINGDRLKYDYCVIAPGVATNFYGHDEWRPLVNVFDSADECRALRDKVAALVASRPELLRVAVIGGGYTGVEYVTHLVKWCKQRGQAYEITVIDIAPEILLPLSATVKGRVKEYLAARQVRLKLSTRIESITAGAVHLADEVVKADVIVWTAGMCGTALCSRLGLLEERGRLKVDETLRPSGLKNVFVAGDAAALYRMAVPFAKQYAAQVVKNIRALEREEPITPFKPKDYGYVVGLAEGEGLGEIMGFPMKGWYGFAFHYFMCVLTLLGFKNKLRLLASFWK